MRGRVRVSVRFRVRVRVRVWVRVRVTVGVRVGSGVRGGLRVRGKRLGATRRDAELAGGLELGLDLGACFGHLIRVRVRAIGLGQG